MKSPRPFLRDLGPAPATRPARQSAPSLARFSAGVVEDLLKQGIAQESDGAVCVFVEGNRAPFIVRKSDGAFTYATTDLAT
ncbi:MAG TPA: arginine--tRNA ligase, partial [Parvularculaceae bacterium]|nr:arginine--tRNA ligase [Parvularculaceae bacterium]